MCRNVIGQSTGVGIKLGYRAAISFELLCEGFNLGIINSVKH